MLNDVTIFDFETTGLSPDTDQVIEIAAIKIVKGQVVTEFCTLVDIEDRRLAPKVTELTGISKEMLDGAMDETLAFRILRNIMGDSLIVAHNAAFDLQFLHWSLQRLGGKPFENQFIDTLTIARERHYYPHKLENMCDRYGITLDGAHRALADVRATWELLKAMHEEERIDSFTNKLGYLNKYGPPEWTPEYAVVFGTDNRYEPRDGATA